MTTTISRQRLQALVSPSTWATLQGAVPASPGPVALSELAGVINDVVDIVDRQRLQAVVGSSSPSSLSSPPSGPPPLTDRETVLLRRPSSLSLSPPPPPPSEIALGIGARVTVTGTLDASGTWVARVPSRVAERIIARATVAGAAHELVIATTPGATKILACAHSVSSHSSAGYFGDDAPVYVVVRGAAFASVSLELIHVETTIHNDDVEDGEINRTPCRAGECFVVDVSDSDAVVEVAVADAAGRSHIIGIVDHEQRVVAPADGELVVRCVGGSGGLHVLRSWNDAADVE